MAVEQSQGAVELVLDTLNSELMSYINKGEAYEQTAVAREYLVSGLTQAILRRVVRLQAFQLPWARGEYIES